MTTVELFWLLPAPILRKIVDDWCNAYRERGAGRRDVKRVRQGQAGALLRLFAARLREGSAHVVGAVEFTRKAGSASPRILGRDRGCASGLDAAFATATTAEIPVLTTLKPSMREEWERFAGKLSDALPPEAEALEDWWRGLSRVLAAA